MPSTLLALVSEHLATSKTAQNRLSVCAYARRAGERPGVTDHLGVPLALEIQIRGGGGGGGDLQVLYIRSTCTFKLHATILDHKAPIIPWGLGYLTPLTSPPPPPPPPLHRPCMHIVISYCTHNIKIANIRSH